MKKVIWGAGYTGSKLLHSLGSENVAFFIDSNPSKQGIHLGKSVLLPENVTEWNDLFVYVPFNYYEDIFRILSQKGLKEHINFEKYGNIFQISSKRAELEMEHAMKDIECIAEVWKNEVLCFTSQFLPGVGCLKFINAMKGNAFDFHLVSEAYWMDYQEIKSRTHTDYFLTVPSLWELHSFVPDGRLDSVEKTELEQRQYLIEIAEQVKEIFYFINEEACCYIVYYNYRYINNLIERVQPKQIIYSSGVKPSGRIVSQICKAKGIPLITSHPGIIPGTLSYDVGGEMGESLPAIYSTRFMGLRVNENDLKHTNESWQYLYKSKLNRKVQPAKKNFEFIKRQMSKGKPVIFFAAQNDPDSHMVPYTEITRKYHSPVFHSSIECGIFLAELCEQNGWNFIFKLHPLYVREEWKNMLPSNTVYIESCNINDLIDFADVTVTILSATSYNALIRYKPVVMLGYTQLRGKGCTYEAFDKDKIEDAIKAALENGFTQEQQDAFLLHMAQCLKYYLYDDLQERPIRYGRPVPKSMDEFYELERLLKVQ